MWLDEGKTQGEEMPKKIQPIKLPETEQSELKEIVSQGYQSARVIARAQILLQSHNGKNPQTIAEWLGVSLGTVYNVRRRYVTTGLKSTLFDSERPGQPAKLNLRQQSQITALACSQAPAGHARWTIRLLADEVVHAEIVDSIAPETIRQFLKKTNLSLG